MTLDDWIELLADRSKAGNIGEYFHRRQCAELLEFLVELKCYRKLTERDKMTNEEHIMKHCKNCICYCCLYRDDCSDNRCDERDDCYKDYCSSYEAEYDWEVDDDGDNSAIYEKDY